MRQIILLGAIVMFSVSLSADKAAPPDIESLMASEDFTASGLNKLTPEERAHLSNWVERYREGAVTGPEVVKKPSQMTEEEKIEYKKDMAFELPAKVLPAFRGWSGKTVFELDNGQVWRQRQPGTMKYSGGNSNVVITRNFLGKYVMKHEASGRAIGGKRID
ncbi:MAG: hypothetical protein V2I48_09790 [Xanthomonadales bacterium]|jgi:hypothetical protein|nr:hypothetical protein [Xanthomonadales bacterium]